MERKQLQMHKRQADAAAVTRTETALNDGLHKKKRKDAEEHIAELILRFASLNLRTGKYCFPRGKQQEVFRWHASKTYSNLNVSFNRVRDRLYRMLAERRKHDEEILEKTRRLEAREDVSLQFLFYFVNPGGFDKTLF